MESGRHDARYTYCRDVSTDTRMHHMRTNINMIVNMYGKTNMKITILKVQSDTNTNKHQCKYTGRYITTTHTPFLFEYGCI